MDSKDGTLTLDPETGAVMAVPKTPTAISKKIIIPSTNIIFIEPA